MKRALPILAVLVALTACQPSQTGNMNVNSNASGNQNANQVAVAGDDESPATCKSAGPNEVLAEINIIPYEVHGAKIERPIPDINISAGQHMVRWCIVNNSDLPIMVLINNLRVKAHPADKNPFGSGDWRDNSFLSKVIRAGKAKHLTTKLASKSGTYEYDILVLDSNGEQLDFEDPQVIISEGFPADVKSGNRNAHAGNANVGDKKNK
jgi:hypothetical protein